MIRTTLTLTFYRELWGSKVDVDFNVVVLDLDGIDSVAKLVAPSLSPGAGWRLWGCKVKSQQSADCTD